MSHKIFHLLSLFLLLVSSMDAYAQLQLGNAPSLPAPEAAGMTRAGNHSVNLYTGRVTVSIPIYTYSDTDFENGLMTKIKYPTGGWTSFEYQPNDYSRCIDKRLSCSYSPAEYLESGTGPGHRIYRIQHYDSNGTLSDSREYRYRKNEGSSTSSGRLLASPRYRVNYSGRVGNTQEYLYYGTLGGLYPTGSVLLEYPRVEEIRGDGSRIVYTFTSWDDIPDIYNHDFNDIARCVNQGPGYNAGVMGGISEKELLNRLLEPASDLQSERGQPLTVSYYVSGETVPVKTEETIYDFLPALPFVSWYANAGDARAEVRIFIDRHQVTGMTVNDRYSSGTVSLDNTYSYNSGGQRISETHTDSNGHKQQVVSQKRIPVLGLLENIT